MSSEASLVTYYAERAAEYDQIYQKPERQTDLGQLKERVARTFAGEDVLELACGTGYWTAVLATSAQSIVAADINDEVLAIAKSRGIDPRRVNFRKADAYSLPKLEQRFSAGLSAFWWSHVSKTRLRGFLQEFHGALAPGALVMFTDNVYVEGSSTPVSRTDEYGDTYQLRRLADGSVHEVRKNFPTEMELRSVVNNLATDVKIEFLRYYWTLTYRLPGQASLATA